MNTKTRSFVSFALMLCTTTLAACDNDPGKNKTKAVVSSPVAISSASNEPSGAEYVFSQADSKLTFVGAKITNKHNGSFQKFSGTIRAPAGRYEQGAVTVEVDMDSLTTDEAKLSGHLKTADFFDVAKYPKARFVSTSVVPGAANGATHTVTGNLELHGVTKSISFPANIRPEGDAIQVATEFVINRKDFGILYPGKPDDLIKDEVAIKLDIHAQKRP